MVGRGRRMSAKRFALTACVLLALLSIEWDGASPQRPCAEAGIL